MALFREREVRAIKLEEARKYREQMEQWIEQQEVKYKERMERLRKREQEVEELAQEKARVCRSCEPPIWF